MSDNDLLAEKQERRAFYLTVLLAASITGLTLWITWQSKVSLIQLMLTGVGTFASIMGIESFVQRIWKTMNPPSSQTGLATRPPRLVKSGIRIHITSFTLSLLFATVCWFFILRYFFAGVANAYYILILAAIFFVVYGLSFFTSNLVVGWLRIKQPRSVFVDRSIEMKRLLDLITDIEGVTWVQIYGIQGIGKTKLMNEFKWHIQRKRLAYRMAWYEFRCFPAEKRDWGTVVRETCKLKYDAHQSSVEQIFEHIKGRAILTIDDFPYDKSTFIEDFLHMLVLLVQKDVLIVTTSRERIRYRRDQLPSDIKAPELISLGSLSSDDIAQFINAFGHIYREKYKKNKAIYNDIYQERVAVKSIAHGHPYTISRILASPEIWSDVKEKPQEEIDNNELCREICDRLMPETMQALQTMAVLAKHSRDWNESVWVGMVQEESVRTILLEKSLIYQVKPIYRMHDIMQDYLYVLVQKNGHKEELHHTAGLFYERKPTDEDAVLLALEHYLSANNVQGVLRVCKNALERSNFLGNFSVTIRLGTQCEMLLKPANKPVTSMTGDSRRSMVDILILQGYAFKVQSQYDRALTTLATCQTLLRPQGKRGQQELVRVGIERSNIYRLQGQYTDALHELETVYSQAVTLKDQANIAEITYGMARMARLQGQLAKAVKYYNEARSSYEALALQDKQAWAFFGLGEVYRLQGDFERSLEAYSRAYQWFQQLRNKEGESYAVWGVGEIKRFRGAFSDAIQHYLRSQQLCKETGDPRSEGWAIMGVAETLRMQKQYQRALEKYQEALVKVCNTDTTYRKLLAELFQHSNPGVERCHIALGLASTLRLLNQVNEEDYAILLRFYEKRSMQQCMVHVLIDVALCCLSNQKKSLSYLDQAQKICTEQSYLLESQHIQNIKGRKGDFLVHPLNFP